MRIYRVKLHEKTYYGSTNQGQVCMLMIRASSAEQACQKAMKYAKQQEFTAVRISDLTEETDVEDVIP